MKHSCLFRALVFTSCAIVLCSGCRRKSPAVDPSPATAAPGVATPQELVPGLPASSQPKVGEPMPPNVTELMLNFEARFGRPPTNYSELSRLKSEPPRK